MSVYFEIAYAIVSGKICLFTGTGFSKAISKNNAPSWEQLLRLLCKDFPDADVLEKELFDKKDKLTLEEAAQVISIEREKNGLSNIHNAACDIIRSIKKCGDLSIFEEFFDDREINIITTNYDKMLEDIIGSMKCNSLTPGLPIPQNKYKANIYHVHGSIDFPENIVITSNDYYQFMRSETYFSRKLSTLLYENTIVILGYSLGDTNLLSILNDYKGFSREKVVSSNIILVSRNEVTQYIKDYYAVSYGIRVIDNMEIRYFFQEVLDVIPEAEKCFSSSIENLDKVINHGHTFTDHYIKIESSFYEIISSIKAIGLSINDKKIVSLMGSIISQKITLTGQFYAWEQYEHLAQWLIYLGSILDIGGTEIEKVYLHAVMKSMTTMSKKLSLGYSWKSFDIWLSKWFEITTKNRALIKRTIEKHPGNADALLIVQQ